jgi:uncharacterized SAM-binding protein YcdF (DUF218 family)
MNLAHSATDRRELVVDVCLGILVGTLLSSLGFDEIVAFPNPGVWIVGGAAFGLVAGVFRQRALLLVLDGMLAAVILVVVWSPMMSALAPRWMRNDALPARFDAVMSLSEGVHSDSTLSSGGFDRLRAAVAIAKSDSTAWLVTSRIRTPFDGVLVVSDTGQRELVDEAGLADRWKIVDHVHDTHDEAVRVAQLLLPARRNLVLVTSPMHTRRACSTFERTGFIVTCRAAREHLRVTSHPQGPLDRLAAFRDYIYELLGMVEYRARGWLNSR